MSTHLPTTLSISFLITFVNYFLDAHADNSTSLSGLDAPCFDFLLGQDRHRSQRLGIDVGEHAVLWHCSSVSSPD